MNKVVLVTGSSRGIGASTIIEFASNGYDVVINYTNNKDKAYELKEYVESSYNVSALCIKCDISNELEVKNMISEIINKYNHIDVLINNASISIDDDMFNKNKEDFMRVLEVNLVGTFLVSREVLKISGLNTIINISSTESIDTYNDLSIDYCSSKAGVNILTKILASKYNNIKICALAPNWVNTGSVKEMLPEYLNSELKRIGQQRLLTEEEVSKKIYSMVYDNSIKSGDIVRLDCED